MLLRRRLGLLFITLLLMMTALAIMGIRNIQIVGEATVQLYDHPYTVSKSIQRIDTNVLRMHNEVKDLTIAKSEFEQTYSKARIAEYEKDINDDLDIIEARFLGEPEKVENLRALINEYISFREDILRLIRDDKQDAALRLTQEKGAFVMKRLKGTIDEFIEFESMKADTFNEQVKETNKNTWTTMSLLFLIAILISGFLSFQLSRSITMPVNQLTEAANRIGNGDFDINLPSDRKDELGLLMRTVNEMNARLKELKEALHKQNQNLEQSIKKRTKELQKKVDELEEFKEMIVGRELKMIELKKQIKELKEGQKK